jgi:hypothetical protein
MYSTRNIRCSGLTRGSRRDVGAQRGLLGPSHVGDGLRLNALLILRLIHTRETSEKPV